MKRFALILATVLVQLAVGDDLYWVKNSNWNNPSNWALGRLPCSGEVASFTSVPDNSLIMLNSNTTVLSIVLPSNGKIVLGSSVAIRFSEDVECQLPTETRPVQNEFTGATDQLWELPENWATSDGTQATQPPCGDDNAFFPTDSTFSFVNSNESITVRSLTVRGKSLQSLLEIQDSNEFRTMADITINPDCGLNPSLCPCIAPATTTMETKTTTKGPVVSETSRNVAGVVVGVLVVVLLLVALTVVVVIVVVFFYMKRKRGFGYAKDELDNAPQEGEFKEPDVDVKDSDDHAFDNPIYDSAEIPTGASVPIGYETKPSLEFADDIPVTVDPTLGKYEQAAEKLKEKEPELKPEPEKEVTPVLGKYQRL